MEKQITGRKFLEYYLVDHEGGHHLAVQAEDTGATCRSYQSTAAFNSYGKLTSNTNLDLKRW